MNHILIKNVFLSDLCAPSEAGGEKGTLIFCSRTRTQRLSKMARIIKFEKKTGKTPDNLITASPWEFRRSYWKGKYFIQVQRAHWNPSEHPEGKHPEIPPHDVLRGGMAHTIHGLYTQREDTKKMREVYYLAGLIDCMINRVNPILRTDLIRDMYNKIIRLKKALHTNWYGHIDHVLLPIDVRFFDQRSYELKLSGTWTMKELYDLIRQGTNEMFAILSREYIFFVPTKNFPFKGKFD